MQVYQERVVQEKFDLDVKINKLSAFLKNKDSESVEILDRCTLIKQLKCMIEYSSILNERIIQFHD